MSLTRMQEPRTSQLIPTMKCGNCGRDVQLRKLSEHLCGEDAPPMPSLPESMAHGQQRRMSVQSDDSFQDLLEKPRSIRDTRHMLVAAKPALNFLEKYNELLGDSESVRSASPLQGLREDGARSVPLPKPSSGGRMPASGGDQSQQQQQQQQERRAVTPAPASGEAAFRDPRPAPPLPSAAGKMEKGGLPNFAHPRPAPPKPGRGATSSDEFTTPRPAPRPPQAAAAAAGASSPVNGARVPPERPARPPVPAPEPSRQPQQNGHARSRSRARGDSTDDDTPIRHPTWITKARPSLMAKPKQHASDERRNRFEDAPPVPQPPQHPRPAPRPPVSGGSATKKNEIDALLEDLRQEIQGLEQQETSQLRRAPPSPSPARRPGPAASPNLGHGTASLNSTGSVSGRHPPSPALASRSPNLAPRPAPQPPSSPTMSSGGMISPRRKVCGVCQSGIAPSEVSLDALNKTFHRRCFHCYECHTPLDQSTGFHEHNAHLYCSQDYAQASARKTCAGCGNVITGKAIFALQQHWHDAHLLCAHCRRPLMRGHVEHRGRVYCQEDFGQLFLPKCKGCRQPVEREALAALDAKWHAACFVCHTCHKPFPDRSFYVFDNAPYCKFHYHEKNNSLCKSCDQPIEGPCAQVLEGRFHPRCFTCTKCQIALTDVYYNFQGAFYCEFDVQAVQARSKKKADRRKTQFGNI